MKNTKYELVAVAAVEKIQKSTNLSPRQAWDLAASDAFGEDSSGQKKGCPRSAFLGLCEAGLVEGIPAGTYLQSQTNKGYTLAAYRLLKESSDWKENKMALWKQVLKEEEKVHNGQLDVVIALREAGKLK